jgi:hypothetical protein
MLPSAHTIPCMNISPALGLITELDELPLCFNLNYRSNHLEKMCRTRQRMINALLPANILQCVSDDFTNKKELSIFTHIRSSQLAYVQRYFVPKK